MRKGALCRLLFDLLFERNAGIAQLVEQLICNQQVIGSSPIAGSLLSKRMRGNISNAAYPERQRPLDTAPGLRVAPTL